MQNKELTLVVGDYNPLHFPSYRKDKVWPKRCAFPGQQMKYLGGNEQTPAPTFTILKTSHTEYEHVCIQHQA